MTDRIASFLFLVALPTFLLPIPKNICFTLCGIGALLLLLRTARADRTLLGVFVCVIALALALPVATYLPFPPLIRLITMLSVWLAVLLLGLLLWRWYERRVGE